ncbi:MAG TPA: hypothetical protein VGO96_19880 [Pyrinomonadaceae bacterium]|nr:hypothetical protein [Pyrinomonadaceae bacterium]
MARLRLSRAPQSGRSFDDARLLSAHRIMLLVALLLLLLSIRLLYALGASVVK